MSARDGWLPQLAYMLENVREREYEQAVQAQSTAPSICHAVSRH